MKKIRTRHFFRALKTVSAFSAGFLLWMLVLGRELVISNFDAVTISVFGIFGLAAISLLAFCFVPYFRGDKRWFSIPAILTSVFFVSLVMIWNVPMGVVI